MTRYFPHAALTFSFVLATMALGQMEVLPPFDGSTQFVGDDNVFGLNTYPTAVSADGNVILGYAEKGIVIVQNNPGSTPGPAPEEIVAYRWTSAIPSELPHYFSSGGGLYLPMPGVLGVSLDGKKSYGFPDSEPFYGMSGGPQIHDSLSGATTPGSFGTWVQFRPGMEGRRTPLDGWFGETSSSNEQVTAVSNDFSTFVGEGPADYARVWTVDTVTDIPPTDGYTFSIATGVSGDGSVVVGYMYNHEAEDGDAGFYWTRIGGTKLIRDLIRPMGYPFDDNQPSINPTAISADGTTIVGTVDGTNDVAARVLPFRLRLDPFVVLTVNVDSDDPDADPDDGNIDVDLDTEGLQISLRAAIEAVNAGFANEIQFNIPGGGVPVIQLTEPLAALEVPVKISGDTQPASGKVEIRGNASILAGLHLGGGNSHVRGLVMNGFSGETATAIKISGPGDNEVFGNFIGTDATGEVKMGRAVSDC